MGVAAPGAVNHLSGYPGVGGAATAVAAPYAPQPARVAQAQQPTQEDKDRNAVWRKGFSESKRFQLKQKLYVQ